MHLIGSPPRNQTFGISNSWLCVLHNVAINVLPLTITKASVALCSKFDAENAITPKDIGTQCSKSADSLVVRSLRDLVALEEVNTRTRQFDHLRKVNRNQIFHTGKTDWGMLQDVDRRVVTHVRQHITKRKRVDYTAECLGSFVIRTNRTASK